MPAEAPRWLETAPESVFVDAPGPYPDPPFDAVATDFDRDGDPDLLLNWHHLRPLELYENREGRFWRVNRPGDDPSGLFDDRDIPSVYAETPPMASRVRREGAPGLHVWHDRNRRGRWRFLWKDPGGTLGPARLEIETAAGDAGGDGLALDAAGRPRVRRERIELAAGAAAREFRATSPVGAPFRLRIAREDGGAPPPLFVGPEATPVRNGAFDVWLPDPHGVAWVHSEGSAHPELFVTRGGIRGSLGPPLDPKEDRYYVHRGGGAPLYRRADAGRVPPDYGRGRRVEWVDVDGDGVLELSIANLAGPNRLLAREVAGGPFRDRAPELGLDVEAHVGAWGDLDEDGRPDFFHLRDGAIDVARNPGGGRFERVPGETLGLVLPPAGAGEPATALRWADFDADGALDLWVLAYGAGGSSHLFRREGRGFRDVSERVGLGAVRGEAVTVLADFDNDGYGDALALGVRVVSPGAAPAPDAPGRALLFRNVSGERFEAGLLPDVRIDGVVRAATTLDVDSDGRTDVIYAATAPGGRRLLRNVAPAGDWLDVIPRDGGREPVGAIVRLHHADGRIAVQRYGSAHSTAWSQALQPLRFGVPAGSAPREIRVLWPGETEAESYPVAARRSAVVVERAAASP